MKTGGEILKIWMKGTTCGRPTVKRTILFESDQHIVLKHHSHAEYCGRMIGSRTCPVHARLYDKAVFDDERPGCDGYYGRGFIREWEGRVKPQKIVDECRALGVTFD